MATTREELSDFFTRMFPDDILQAMGAELDMVSKELRGKHASFGLKGDLQLEMWIDAIADALEGRP